MNNPIAAYSFLPWARQGLGKHIQDAASGQLRGTVPVNITLRGTKVDKTPDATETVSRPVQLYGPGDIVGVDARAIFRTEPRHWITNFEPNYLPFVEFTDEDFAWRYTPAAPSPDQRRLTPWLTLAVLEEGEFEDGGNIVGRPLSFITITNAATKLPPADQLWAWAHVHVNGSLGGDRDDTAGLAQRLQQTLATDRDQAFSRLMSPRALKPNTAYHAFVVPTFESGRLAGLGIDPAGATSATQIAWSDPAALEFPFYHRWYFRTGSAGDFEYLVRLLVPQPVDARVGSRDMDVQAPGSGLPAITQLDGLLRLGGALRAPMPTLGTPEHTEWDRWEHWAKPYPQPFQDELTKFLNLPETYAKSGVLDAAGNASLEDPLIAPPIYGRWHAAVTTLDPLGSAPQSSNWIHELNLDPRFRTGAGFGTKVVQQQQEAYMEDAWKQVGEVLAANQRIRYATMAMAASKAWQFRHLEPLMQQQPERYLMVAAPVQRRVLAEGLTVHHRFVEGTVPPAMLSKVSRQVLRPRGRVAKRVGLDGTRRLDNLLGRINRGEVVVVPRKTVPAGLPTGDKIAEILTPDGLPDFIVEPIRNVPWLRWLPLLIALLLFVMLMAFGFLGWLLGGLLVAAAVWFARRAAAAIATGAALEAIKSGGTTAEAVDALPSSPDFRIDALPTDTAPMLGASSGSDSEDARRFKAALRNVALLDQAEGNLPVAERKALNLPQLARTTLEQLKPERTIPAWTLMHVAIPPRIRAAMVEDFGEVMVYPVIDAPMYEPLKDLSGELFVPNLQLIPVNSITLLETNQKFIEAYMVGLNHEFSRELLWREYPTDQRGSCFRQFWDVRGFLADPALDPIALRERLRDIPELHRWGLSGELGDHDHREAQGDKEDELVLVIRGELLKKYPTAVIYAHRADWERKADGSIDKSKPRKLKDLGAQEAKPPRDLVKTPLYEAKVDPDIYFFGFDITAPKAKGGIVPRGATEEDPGWFFVIKERPGEPRFGLDLAKDAPQAALGTWNDLAWSDVMTPYKPGQFLRAGGGTPPALTLPGGEALEQHNDDKAYRWRPDTHAAELAYILYQVPVLMAVHAAEMLPKT
jgi:hypothetical protein